MGILLTFLSIGSSCIRLLVRAHQVWKHGMLMGIMAITGSRIFAGALRTKMQTIDASMALMFMEKDMGCIS